MTVPVDVRRELDLRRGDRVAFVMEDGAVRLVRSGSVVERTAGVFKGRGKALTAEQLRDAAEIAIAEEAIERSSS